MTTISFSELGISDSQCRVLSELGYHNPTPIQEKCIPEILMGNDIIGQAQTGTGKTAAFALPILASIDPDCRDTQTLVLAPTRELALQIAESFKSFIDSPKLCRVAALCGGQSMSNQIRDLRSGPQIVVGTPGRVLDHLRRKSLSLKKLSCLVLDEADEMLRQGFIEDVEYVLENSPNEKQVIFLSATMPQAMKRIARKHLNDPFEVKIQTSEKNTPKIEQFFWKVQGVNKLDALTRILEFEPYQAVILFTRTKSATLEVSEQLRSRGFSTAALNGDMSQKDREHTVERLRKGSISILVATDVAARGLDVEGIEIVINYDAPQDLESYVHRIGRTGRAGRTGKSIIFLSPRGMRVLRDIEKITKSTVSSYELPSYHQVLEIKKSKLKKKIADKIQSMKDSPYLMDTVNELLADGFHPAHVAIASLALLEPEKPKTPKKQDSGKDFSKGKFKKRRANGDRSSRTKDSSKRQGKKFDKSKPKKKFRKARK